MYISTIFVLCVCHGYGIIYKNNPLLQSACLCCKVRISMDIALKNINQNRRKNYL